MVAGELVFIGSCNGVFRALELRTGRVRWETKISDSAVRYFFHGDPVVAGDIVVAAADRTSGAAIHALHTSTGKEVWKHAAGRGATLSWLSAPETLGQPPAVPADQWAAVRFLLGSWEGTSSGQAGDATVRREYRFALRERFIEERHTSTYPPQEKNPKGEVHEHLSYLSYDRARKLLVLRQFHVERFVIQYAQERDSSAGALVFLSEALENAPAGWRARESYTLHGPDEFEEVFELAEAGKAFHVYSRTRLKRVR